MIRMCGDNKNVLEWSRVISVIALYYDDSVVLKVVLLLVVDHDHVNGGWSCINISRVDDVIFLVWFVGGLVYWF